VSEAGTSGPDERWRAPESGVGGWGPPPGAPERTDARVPPSGAADGTRPPPSGQGWGQMTGAGQQPYGSVLTRRGIIALKPLGFGDFFDGSFRAIRHNPRAMIGLSALVLAVTNVLVALPVIGLVSISSFTDPTAEPTDTEIATALGSLVALVPAGFLQSVAIIVLTGMLILSVTQSVVDRRLGTGDLWRRAKGRVWPLVGWSLLLSLGGALLAAAALAPGIVLLVLEEFASGAVALLVLGLAAVALAVWLYIKLTFVPVLIVVERLGILASVRRSAQLTKGAFWRTLLVLILTGILASIVSQVLATPFTIVGALALTLLQDDPLLGGTLYAATLSLGTTVGLVLAIPFLAAVVALLYVDRRIRLEGLDVTLARTLEDEQA